MSSPLERLADWYRAAGASESDNAERQQRSNLAAEAASKHAYSRAAEGPISDVALQYERLLESRPSPEDKERYTQWKAALREFAQESRVKQDERVNTLCQDLMRRNGIL